MNHHFLNESELASIEAGMITRRTFRRLIEEIRTYQATVKAFQMFSQIDKEKIDRFNSLTAEEIAREIHG
jgi:hypothetical protein